MADVQIAHTAWLSPEQLQAIRILLDEAFDGDVIDDDYEHALGGMHALVWEGRELIGHGSVDDSAGAGDPRGVRDWCAGLSDEAADFYAVRDWQLWMGTASVIAPGGIERTAEEEGCIYVLPVSVELTPLPVAESLRDWD
jgi:aminoglycoside 2'-N-acetyltransferase I